MVNLEKINALGRHYDLKNRNDEPDYESNHKKLCKMVDDYGLVLTAAATGLKESTVRQHCRDKSSKRAMVSNKSIERAEAIFSKV